MQLPGRIAIDGPAGSGKSTIGEQVARHLEYLYIDTGAMYRALTWLALQEGVPISDEELLASLARRTEIAIHTPEIQDGRQYTVTVREQDVTWEIRNAAVTSSVSTVSTHKKVRAIIILQQRAMAQQGRVVMVGRDIGAVVLPDAELKIFLTASLEERARRRYVELMERMGEQNPDLPTMESVLQDIQRRDFQDRNNLLQAADAFVLSTDHLSVQQVLQAIYRRLEDPA